MRIGTRVVRAGLPPARDGKPLLPGPVFAATYHLRGDPPAGDSGYGRTHNPTWLALEAALGELDGGYSVVYSSGMAAISAAMRTFVKPKSRLVIPADGYYRVRELSARLADEMGVDVRRVRFATEDAAEAVRGADVVWLESPTNPRLDVCDIAAAAEAAHDVGAVVVVDNTTPTAVGQDALGLGADIVVASDTKALIGHSDLVLGHATARDEGHAARLRGERDLHGAIAGPQEAWLAHRSLATLELRLQRQSANALAIATYLAQAPQPTRVRYPGLPHDPAHQIASRQMRLFGPVLGFALPSRRAAEAFLAASALIIEATSFGGVHTTAERRARWGGDDVEAGFIRLSVGCEDSEDLIDDIVAALAAIPT